MNPPISACVICFNERDNIRACLSSLKWADEIIVVDSGSTDGTLEICREFTDKVYQNTWPGFVAQKNYALSLAQNDWVISVDADEVVSPELPAEITALWASDAPQKHNGFYLPRRTYYLGKWIKHGGWYPDYKLRLFRRSRGKWEGAELHEKVILTTGETKKLMNPLLHYNYRDITDQIRAIDNFSTLAASEMVQAGKESCLLHLVFGPPVKFLETYFCKLGFLDGLPGLIISVNTAFYTFNKYAKVWEKKSSKEQTPPQS